MTSLSERSGIRKTFKHFGHFPYSPAFSLETHISLPQCEHLNSIFPILPAPLFGFLLRQAEILNADKRKGRIQSHSPHGLPQPEKKCKRIHPNMGATFSSGFFSLKTRIKLAFVVV
jgi:hypothetical protein